MRRFASVLAASLILVAACEARVPEPSATEPAKPAAPVAPAPTPEPTPEPADDGLARVGDVRYLELVTAGADPEAELPMIVAIHGLGDSPEGFGGLLEGFDRPARVIVPRALDPYEPGWSWFPIRARDTDVEALARGIARAADTLAPAIATLTSERPTRGKPIVTGFSQGGMLSFALAVRHGELFAAALPIGGTLPPPLWPEPDARPGAAPPIHAFHGDADPAVPYASTQATIARLEQAGYDVKLDTYPGVGHAIPPDMRAGLMAALRESLADVL